MSKNLASKLQRNKDDKRKGPKPANSLSAAPTYSNVLKSIDDETLIDDADDALEIDMASEQNRYDFVCILFSFVLQTILA